MSRPAVALSFALITSALLAAPSGARAGIYLDPIGDAKSGGAGQGAVAIDVASISVFFDATSFFVEMTFDPSTPIAPPSSGAANGVAGAIEFDIDRDPATGTLGFNDSFRDLIGEPLTGLGVDGGIDLFSEAFHPGEVDIFFGSSIAAAVPIDYTLTGFTVVFPRSLFGGAGVADFAALVGDFVGPTDAAPAAPGVSSPRAVQAVPEPGGLALLGIGSVAAAVGWRRRRAEDP